MKKLFIPVILTGLCLTQFACSNKEYLNPSTVSQSQAVSSSDGLLTLSNGLQYRYTTGGALSILYASTAGAGLTTREEAVLNAGNADETNLALGLSNISNINSVVRNLWTQSHLVRSNAELILASTGVVSEAGTKSGIVAYASIFRALSLGTLGLFFEQSPITTGNNVPFVPRAQVFKEAITTLEAAATQVATTPASADFTGKIVPGIDLANTIQALIARYALFSGDYDKALAAAAKVDLTKKSVFNFDDNTRNPLFEYTFGNLNVFQPTNANLGLTGVLTPDAADKRIAFLTKPSTNTAVTPVIATAFYTANNAAVPVYLPGEMLLIQAEAAARKGDLAGAVTALNKVLTKTAATDVFGIGAGLPAYAGAQTADAILTEIYKNRQIELAYQGFRLEDSRRFNRPGPGVAGAERNRNFFPYPLTERNNNTSTPLVDPN